ncbi:MAG: hypothetical protein HC925_07460 [Coleofasciculaceae cyanobacterium SM2_3_26]|nr:hypothetical protein [Coleofasciculaceae cyanobacterium SM2_3_26]
MTFVRTGAMNLLNPIQMLKDEGVFRTLRFGWNVLTQAPIRQRVRSMYRTFEHHRENLGYIIILATVSP